MTHPWGNLRQRLLHAMLRQITFPEAALTKIQRAAAAGQVVYVGRTLSYVDYLYFAYALAARSLPLAAFADGVWAWPMMHLWQMLRNLMALRRGSDASQLQAFSDIAKSGAPTMLFLKRPQTLWASDPRGFGGNFFETLVRLARGRDQSAPPLMLVPLVLFWGSPAVRSAHSHRSWLDVVFGDSEAPGRLRALLSFLWNFRSSHVTATEPLNLNQFLAENRELTDEQAARRLKWLLSGRIEGEVRSVLGPKRKGARRIGQEVLRSRKLVKEAQAIAAEENISADQLRARAESALREIAAEPKPWIFELIRPTLRVVWRRIFEGIEVDQVGLEKVREAARRGPLILVPSHKSHIDYLILSFMFIDHGLVPPHIAAGSNLSFFPLGYIFRRAGAFFLRRSFKGDRLYAAVFRAYVRKLLREGHSIEFFIEGGRSRTGKLLVPRLGMLGMMTEAALDSDGAQARRAHVVPISIGYEKVIEERSYARELAGGEKRKEDVKGLLRATRVLKGNYGRLNIQFDEPFLLGSALREAGAMVAWDENQDVVVPAEEAATRLATVRLAHRIVYGINRVTAVTPTSLTAAALLCSGRRGQTRKQLLDEARFLVGRARAVGGRLAESVVNEQSGLNTDAIDHALDLLATDGHLQIRSEQGTRQGGRHGDDEIYTVPDEHRQALTFYRNNAIHLYVADGLVALALVSAVHDDQSLGRTELRDRTLRLSRLLKLEFSYRVGETFESIFEGTLAGLLSAGLVADLDGKQLRIGDAGHLSILSGLIVDFVESYWVVASSFDGLHGAVNKKELLRRIHDCGERAYLSGALHRREACVDANFQNAIAYFTERGYLVEHDKKFQLAPDFVAAKLVAEIAELIPPTERG